MKAWISKYALSADVYEKEGTVSGGLFFTYDCTLGPMKMAVDAHLTKEAAIADAERRRTERIASLENQIKKLKALKFK